MARALAPLLQTDESSLAARLAPRLTEVNGKTNFSQYVVLKNKVPMDTWEKIRQTMARLSFGADETKLKPSERAFYRNIREQGHFCGGRPDPGLSQPAPGRACSWVSSPTARNRPA